jgi:hypothetical protein
MRRRGVVVLALLAGVVTALTVTSALFYAARYAELVELTMQPTSDPSAYDEYWIEMNSLSALINMLPWLSLAALLAAVATLALAARRAQLQLAGSASATASRVASSAASVSAGSAESIS